MCSFYEAHFILWPDFTSSARICVCAIILIDLFSLLVRKVCICNWTKCAQSVKYHKRIWISWRAQESHTETITFIIQFFVFAYTRKKSFEVIYFLREREKKEVFARAQHSLRVLLLAAVLSLALQSRRYFISFSGYDCRVSLAAWFYAQFCLLSVCRSIAFRLRFVYFTISFCSHSLEPVPVSL